MPTYSQYLLMYSLLHISLYADFQYRYVHYKRNGLNDEDMTDLPLEVDFHFFNPKAGFPKLRIPHELLVCLLKTLHGINLTTEPHSVASTGTQQSLA